MNLVIPSATAPTSFAGGSPTVAHAPQTFQGTLERAIHTVNPTAQPAAVTRAGLPPALVLTLPIISGQLKADIQTGKGALQKAGANATSSTSSAPAGGAEQEQGDRGSSSTNSRDSSLNIPPLPPSPAETSPSPVPLPAVVLEPLVHQPALRGSMEDAAAGPGTIPSVAAQPGGPFVSKGTLIASSIEVFKGEQETDSIARISDSASAGRTRGPVPAAAGQDGVGRQSSGNTSLNSLNQESAAQQEAALNRTGGPGRNSGSHPFDRPLTPPIVSARADIASSPTISEHASSEYPSAPVKLDPESRQLDALPHPGATGPQAVESTIERAALSTASTAHTRVAGGFSAASSMLPVQPAEVSAGLSPTAAGSSQLHPQAMTDTSDLPHTPSPGFSAAHTFERLDAGVPWNATPLRADARSLEVGVQSGSLGWLEVRATTDAQGQISASLHAQSDASAQSLSGHIEHIVSYAQQHAATVEQVSVGVNTGDASQQRNHNAPGDNNSDGAAVAPVRMANPTGDTEEVEPGSTSLISVRA